MECDAVIAVAARGQSTSRELRWPAQFVAGPAHSNEAQMNTSPDDSFLYRAWLIWPPRTEEQLWTASKEGLLRTARDRAELMRQIDEYEDGDE